MTKRRLFKAVENLDIQKKDLEYEIPGVLGFTVNGENIVDVATREGFVWVRLRNNQNEVIQAYNDEVATVYDLPVLVTRDRINKGRYKIVSRDVGQYSVWGSNYTPKHGNQHSFNPDSGGGGDIVWVFSQQFMPLLAYPSGSSGAGNIMVNGYAHYDGSQWKYLGNTGTAGFSAYKPTGSSARLVLVFINTDGNFGYYPGDFFTSTITGTAEVTPYIPHPTGTNVEIPIVAVRLVSGTNNIVWSNLYDVRPFYTSL